MAYIANKPIRFDRDYKVGEIIPDGIIDPAAEKRLILWGKITKTDISSENIKSFLGDTKISEKVNKSKKAVKG